MREIKFKVLRNGTWSHLILDYPAAIAKELLTQWEDGDVVKFETPWLEFTGLHDKNGVEIYEGDICRIDTKGAFPPYGNPDSEDLTGIATLAVEWWNGQFVFNANRYKFLDNGGDDYINFGWWVKSNNHTTTIKQIEVIGNISENPELAK